VLLVKELLVFCPPPKVKDGVLVFGFGALNEKEGAKE
jgi:hypothetical protein